MVGLPGSNYLAVDSGLVVRRARRRRRIRSHNAIVATVTNGDQREQRPHNRGADRFAKATRFDPGLVHQTFIRTLNRP
jgi:hypothetical protein